MKGNRKQRKNRQSGQHLSRLMSMLLRHGAVDEGIKMDSSGYITIEDLIAYIKKKGYADVTFEQIQKIVDTNDKKRFQIKHDKHNIFIRATQGHSINLVKTEDLLTKIEDPYEYPVVIHGTFMKFWGAIKKQGLNRMKRNHIHFIPGRPDDKEIISGMKNKCDVLIQIDLFKAMKQGIKFYISSNNVILTEGQDGVLKPQFFKRVETKNGQILFQQNEKIQQK